MNTFPLVHMNGTSGIQLQDQYEAAGEALNNFIERWHEIDFNARDYYPRGDAAWTQAVKDRECCNAHISAMKTYLADHYNNLEEQNEARRRRR